MQSPDHPKSSVAVLRSRFREGHIALPLLPSVAAEVLATVDSGDCDARSLAALIQRDPSLSAHVLRVANSPRYAPEQSIVSVMQAVSRLGLRTLREIVISVAVHGAVFDVPGQGEFLSRIWRHSVATGRLAGEIARHRRKNVEAAFLCGLLHDIGKPIVLHELVRMSRAAGGRVAASQVEEACEALHCEVGVALVQQWSLPPFVGDAVSSHHSPADAEEHSDLVLTVALADALMDWMDETDGEGAPPGFEYAERLELYSDDMDRLVAWSASMVEEGTVC